MIPTNQRNIQELAAVIAATIQAKNHDYGGAFAKQYDKFGILYAVSKLSEKYDRIEALATEHAEVKGEPLEDALLDLAGYCLLTLDQLHQRAELGEEK